jgi:hypothetical protein
MYAGGGGQYTIHFLTSVILKKCVHGRVIFGDKNASIVNGQPINLYIFKSTIRFLNKT